MTLSLPEHYRRGDRPWALIDGTFYESRERGERNATLGKKRISLQPVGSASSAELGQVLENRHLLSGVRRASGARSLAGRIEEAYYKTARPYERAALRELSRVQVRQGVVEGLEEPVLESMLRRAHPCDGYLVSRENVYGLVAGGGGTQLSLDGRSYGVVEVGHERTVLRGYEDSLRREYKSLRGARSESAITVKEQGGKHVVSVDVEPFVMRTAFGDYRFGGFTMAYSFRRRGGEAFLDAYPRVTTPGYDHPFLFSGANICFNSKKSWDEKGIEPEVGFPADVTRLSFAACEAARTMRCGYSENATPVRDIRGFSTIDDRSIAAEGLGVYENRF